jgi:ribonuclease-3
LLLGKGEAGAGGRSKPSILSDALEAVLGAVYIDGGAPSAYEVIERLIGPEIGRAINNLDRLDYKTQLQEVVARKFETAPVYLLREQGPDHDKRFFATVLVAGDPLGHGEGRSKKQAEQVAAEEAFTRLVVAAGDA